MKTLRAKPSISVSLAQRNDSCRQEQKSTSVRMESPDRTVFHVVAWGAIERFVQVEAFSAGVISSRNAASLDSPGLGS